MVHRKYRLLFSSPCQTRKPGPKGPSEQLIAAIVEMKHRNPKFGCVRMAQQIAHAFGIEIDKDVVRRVLATRARPKPHSDGPSWLTLIAQAKDSVWSVDLFRVEIGRPAQPLGPAGHGHLHPSHHRLWHRPHMDRWHVGVPNVQCRRHRAVQTEIPQYRS